ncbi:MAG: Lrp/AsnC family transcriptional regulator [Thermoplasmata archaeon]|nr:MAG: Lrp/AsnC family transcriptional regulator [Thermoplasmata archaeon]
MIEIERGSIEARIIEVLQEVYPISIKELQKELSISEKMLERGIKRLQTRGIITLEPLPDKTYIRLLRMDFHFVGRKATQRKPIKRKGGKKKGKDYDGMAYG